MLKFLKKRHLLLVIIIIAILLRVFGSGIIEHPDFFSDEIGRITTAKSMITVGQPILWYTNGVPILHFSHPPFDKLAYTLFMSITQNDYYIRLFPIAAGILTIVLTYYLGCVLSGKNTGLVAALLMTVSRYHVYGSQLIDVDGSFLPLFAIATILFFVVYKQKSDKYRSMFAARKYLFLSMLFFGLCVFTKLLGAIIIVPIMVYSIYYDKNRINLTTTNRRLIKKAHIAELMYFIIAAVVTLIIILAIALAYNNIDWFNGPINVLLHSAEGTANTGIVSILTNKAFTLATVGWQLTPFLGALMLLALAFVKKDENYMLLATWILFSLFVFLLPYSGDVQRYFTIALPAVFLLVSRYIANKEISNKIVMNIGILTVAAFAISALLGINDLMGYYDTLLVGAIFFVAAAIMFIPRKYSAQILLAGFIGMSAFAVIGTNAWIGIGSYTVHELANDVKELGWPYQQVWAWEDIRYQITPKNETIVSMRPDLNEDFVREHDVQYIAVHTLRDEALFKEFAKNCTYSKFIVVDNHVTGLLCKI